MKEIITQLIAAAIDANKIPGLDCFDMNHRANGFFVIRLNDGTAIKVEVEVTETW